MTGIRDLLASGRGFMCLALIVVSVVFASVGVITGAQWIDFAKIIVTTLVASKTLSGAAESFATKGASVMARHEPRK